MNSNNQNQDTDERRLYCRTCQKFIGTADEYAPDRIENHETAEHPAWNAEYHIYAVAPHEDPENAWRNA